MFKYFFQVIIFLTAFLFSFRAHADEQGVNIFVHARQLPSSKLINQNGQSVKLSDLKDEFVVAVFWSRDCPPCLKELRSLNGFHNEVKNNGIHLMLISPEKEWASIQEQKKFLKRFGATDVDFYLDPQGQAAADLGIFTSPHTVLINRRGQEIGRIRGAAKWDDRRVIEYIYNIKANHG